jgi:DegV family protein with EDD domain
MPLNIFYDGQKFKENSDYDFKKHYNHYETDPKFSPKTAQPTPQDFLKAYLELVEEGATDIIVITISSALSGTMNSANLAKTKLAEMHPDVTVHLIDSKNASYAEGFLIEEALSFINEGKEAKEIVKILKTLVLKIKSYLIVPTLKYLYQGGRISWAKYMLARFLRKKLIVTTAEDGSLQPLGTFGNIDDGVEKTIEFIVNNDLGLPRKIAIVYANNLKLRDLAIKKVKKELPDIKPVTIRTRAAITAHVGPSTIAIVAEYDFE